MSDATSVDTRTCEAAGTGGDHPRIAFRPLERADFARLHGWLCEPEVARWYSSGAPTRAAVARKYGPRVAGRSPTRCYVTCIDGRDAGLVQAYPLADYAELAAALGAGPGWAGLDYFLGEPALRGRGLAHRVVAAFVDAIVAQLDGIETCASLPAHDNAKSIRALTRAGFRRRRRVELEPGQIDALMVRELGSQNPATAPGESRGTRER